MRNALLSLILGVLLPTVLRAQDIDIVSGSLDSVEREVAVNVRFSYEGMLVGETGMTDLEYQAKREHELDMRTPNSGGEWRRFWIGGREAQYQPSFIRTFNSLKRKTRLGDFPTAKYTMLVRTTKLEPGWTAVVSGHAAYISGEARIFETADTTRTVCVIEFRKAASKTKNFEINPVPRISRAYAVAGYRVGKLFRR